MKLFMLRQLKGALVAQRFQPFKVTVIRTVATRLDHQAFVRRETHQCVDVTVSIIASK